MVLVFLGSLPKKKKCDSHIFAILTNKILHVVKTEGRRLLKKTSLFTFYCFQTAISHRAGPRKTPTEAGGTLGKVSRMGSPLRPVGLLLTLWCCCRKYRKYMSNCNQIPNSLKQNAQRCNWYLFLQMLSGWTTLRHIEEAATEGPESPFLEKVENRAETWGLTWGHN